MCQDIFQLTLMNVRGVTSSNQSLKLSKPVLNFSQTGDEIVPNRSQTCPEKVLNLSQTGPEQVLILSQTPVLNKTLSLSWTHTSSRLVGSQSALSKLLHSKVDLIIIKLPKASLYPVPESYWTAISINKLTLTSQQQHNYHNYLSLFSERLWKCFTSVQFSLIYYLPVNFNLKSCIFDFFENHISKQNNSVTDPLQRKCIRNTWTWKYCLLKS